MKKRIGLVGLVLLISCSMGKQKKTQIENNGMAQELIVYAVPGSTFDFRDGMFYASEEEVVKKINSELKMHKVQITELSGLAASQKIFRIMVQGNAESLRDFLLKETALIDGAYIKPASEDPGEQIPNRNP